MTFNPYLESAKVLVDSEDTNVGAARYILMREAQTVLENSESPVTRNLHEKLMQEVIDRGHIDFGSIPKSAGDIRAYDGYANMVETLSAIAQLATAQNAKEVLACTNTVQKAVGFIEGLHSTYAKGYLMKNDYVMLEYQTYVYTCVEATTSLINQFIEFIKRPDQTTMISFKNTKGRADLFYFEQLEKFNRVNENMGINYRKMLEAMCENGKNNFVGIDTATFIGVAAVSAVILAIVPVTRELIYSVYAVRGNLSRSLETQAKFLEMNKACVESNDVFTVDKKKKIIQKQEALRKNLLRLSEFLRVKTVKGRKDAEKALKESNKMLSIDNIRNDVSSSSLDLF